MFSRLTLCILAVIVPAAAVRSDDDPKLARAREVLKLLTTEHYPEFCAAGDATMQAKFPPADAEKLWSGLKFQLGEYKTEESAKLVPAGALDAAIFGLRFARGVCTLRLVLDHDGKMSGLWLDKLDANVDYAKPPYVNADAFTEEAVTVSAGEFPLPGTLSLPKGDTAHPAVVLVHGSGPNDRNETVGANQPFRDLAGGLASRGIAVLRYDKRTKVHPTSRAPGDWTMDDEVIDDAVAAAKLLRGHAGIDAKRVYVLGHSMGASLAPYIAEKDGQLAGIIVAAGSARSVCDVLEDQVAYLNGLNGEPSEQAKKDFKKLQDDLDLIRAGKATAMREPVLGVPAIYWERVQKLDPCGVAVRLQIPILILQGARDYQVTEKDYAIWQARLGDCNNVTFKRFDDLNHLFVAGSGKSTPAEYQQPGHVDAQLIETIAGWISH